MSNKELTLDEIKKMNVHQRIHAIQSEIGTVSKEGHNSHQNYKYAKEADFVRALKPLLNKYRLVVVPNVTNMSYPQGHEKMAGLVDLRMMFAIINIDNPLDQVLASMAGQGKDNGDKAIFKAISGTKKYFMAVQFQIPTGDDPEGDESVDRPEKNSTKSESSSSSEPSAPATGTKPASFRKPKQEAAKQAPVQEPVTAGEDW
jgi:hypothetical protein